MAQELRDQHGIALIDLHDRQARAHDVPEDLRAHEGGLGGAAGRETLLHELEEASGARYLARVLLEVVVRVRDAAVSAHLLAELQGERLVVVEHPGEPVRDALAVLEERAPERLARSEAVLAREVDARAGAEPCDCIDRLHVGGLLQQGVLEFQAGRLGVLVLSREACVSRAAVPLARQDVEERLRGGDGRVQALQAASELRRQPLARQI